MTAIIRAPGGGTEPPTAYALAAYAQTGDKPNLFQLLSEIYDAERALAQTERLVADANLDLDGMADEIDAYLEEAE